METLIQPIKTQNSTQFYQLTASAFGWSISETKTVRAWGFNESLPGPVIRANKGDKVIVRVKNELEQPTIIHWHGIRLESGMDGTNHTQKPIQPGEQFEYVFNVPDAGTFWYHSHFNETEQMERGMYGALIVSDPDDPKLDGEKVFMIDDMKLEKDSSFKKGNAITRWIERHDGREGNTLLINGKVNPTIKVNGGQSERWRFINASSARYFQLYLGGRKFTVIASDGGLIERPYQTDRILLVPGERVDIIGGPFSEDETIELESLPYNRMTFVKSKRQNFATIQVGKTQASSFTLPEVLRVIEPLAFPGAPVNRKVNFSVAPALKHIIDFKVNGEVHNNDAPVEVGKLQIWEVANTSLMDHPFHLHGFFFQVLEVNGKPAQHLMWKDTINLTPRSKIKIAWMPDNRPGKWMYHCHILEHHEAGMMAHFEVVNSGEEDTTSHHHLTGPEHSCTNHN